MLLSIFSSDCLSLSLEPRAWSERPSAGPSPAASRRASRTGPATTRTHCPFPARSLHAAASSDRRRADGAESSAREIFVRQQLSRENSRPPLRRLRREAPPRLDLQEFAEGQIAPLAPIARLREPAERRGQVGR